MKPAIGSLQRLTPSEHGAIAHLAQELRRAWGESDLDSVRLFGSKARGESKSTSDVDVLVVASHLSEQRRNFLYELVLRIVEDFGVYLSVKLFSKEEFQEYASIPSPFVRNVLREGVAVS